MKVNRRKLLEYVDKGLLTARVHPVYPLTIWNYTNKTQYDRMWDKYTISCRGLITDINDNIIAKPFDKFFNIDERPDTQLANLPIEAPFILEKLDGSMGVLFIWNGLIHVATRGAFESEQAIWATAWVRERFNPEQFNPHYTYIVEIIYPEDRKVVDYKGRQEVVLLAINDLWSETELSYEKTVIEARRIGFSVVNKINDTLLNVYNGKKILEEAEGYVALFSNGVRVKIKGDWYFRIAKLINHLTDNAIIEAMAKGDIEKLILGLPDEDYQWAQQRIRYHRGEFSKVEHKALECLDIVSKMATRKEQALFIKANYNGVSSIVFVMLNGGFYKNLIWSILAGKHIV